MAIYELTVDSDGKIYNSTADGYQIGGNDKCSASVTFQLPNNGSQPSFVGNQVIFTFYAATSKEGWDTSVYNSWYLTVTINGQSASMSLAGTYSHVKSSGTKHTLAFTFSGDPVLNDLPAGTEFTLTIDGSSGGFISSGGCLYLCSATFVSGLLNYLCVASFSQANVSATSKGTYYMKIKDYRKYIGYYWGSDSGFVKVELDGKGNNYHSSATYYTAHLSNLTDGSGNRLFVK